MALKKTELKSFAKVNLSLDVTGILEDGYHGVETVMAKVGLWDEIEISWDESAADGFEIRLRTNRKYLPCDERNLAYKAALLMKEKSGFEAPGVLNINIRKRIPVAAGLAGGSGNGAAVIIGLNRLWNLGYTTKELCGISEALGSDVPFMVLIQNSRYTYALGTGKGEILTPLKTDMSGFVVLVKPGFGVSTKEVYNGIDNCGIEKRPNTAEMVKNLRTGNMQGVLDNMINVLECYTLEKYPQVQQVKEKIACTRGVKKVLMSGSGPTVYGIYESFDDAREACLYFREEGFESYWALMGSELRRLRKDD